MEARRARTVVAAPLLLLAGVLFLGSLSFNLSHLDTGAERLPPIPPIGGFGSAGGLGAAEPGSGNAARAFFQVLLWGLLAAGVLSVVLWKVLGKKLRDMVTPWELLGYGLLIVLFLTLVFFWQDVAEGIHGAFRSFGGSEPAGPSLGPGQSRDPAVGAVVLMFVIVGILVAPFAVYLARFLRAMAAPPPPKESPREMAARVVARAVTALRAGGDFRAAVIQCYSDFCTVLAARGLRSQDSLTAREIESLAQAKIGLTRGSLDALTVLFEEARYSHHPIGADQRDAAVGALESIKRELEGSPRASA